MTSSTIWGGIGGAAIWLGQGNTGSINLSSNIITSNGGAGAYYGLLIATQGAAGQTFTGLSITSMTFMGPLPLGTTAINFTGGRFLSTFTSVGFYDTNIGANINASPLSPATSIYMVAPSGQRSGPGYANDPNYVVHWSTMPAGASVIESSTSS